MHAAEIDTDQLGDRRSLTMPSVSVTVGEQIQALERAAGPATVALIREEPDQTIASIVAGWPRRFDTARADALGFRCESTFDEIIEIYIADEKIQLG